jgi:hypothetical protein
MMTFLEYQHSWDVLAITFREMLNSVSEIMVKETKMTI